MSKCISCHKTKGEYEHHSGGFVCEGCIGNYFTCPDCGILYDLDDYDHGDQGNGFCIDCYRSH